MGPEALLVTEADWAAETAPTSSEPKLRLVGVKVRAGTPVPVRVARRVEPLEPTVRTPVRGPSAVGEKTTAMLQEAPAATTLQLLEVTAKSPVAVSEVTPPGKVELLVHVKVMEAEEKPTAMEPKSCDAGTRVADAPLLVSSKRLYSRSFSCGVAGAARLHSAGKPLAGEAVSTWYSLRGRGRIGWG